MAQRLQPGDMLFHSPNLDKWTGVRVTIKKVGRKWATLVDGRFDARVDIETLELDGRRSYGRLWWTEADWQTARDADQKRILADREWEAFVRLVRQRWLRPAHLDAEAIAAPLCALTPIPKD